MGMFRGVVTVGVLVSLSGCGAYTDFKASNAVQEYRQTCFGNYTNECESKLVDTNIVLLEIARSGIDRQKESIIKIGGKDGFELFSKIANEQIDDLIEQQENKRPGFFARWVLGEGQPFTNTHNLLLDISDMQELHAAVLKKVSASIQAKKASVKPEEPMSETAAILLGKTPPAPTQVQAAPSAPTTPPVTQAVEPVAQAKAVVPSDLAASADRMIANEIAQDGGDEYKDARQVIFADLNNDGIQDAVLLYTIEGQGGGNGYFQSLAAFIGGSAGWDFRGKAVVGNGVQDIQVIDSQTLKLTVLSVGPDDADCCPSVQSTENYKWDGTTFLQAPTT
ncbi:hypothetical protein [Pseudomonas sp. TSRC2-2]|uniref:hypothetical protein n=1 Tax=Pseudomonas sp. TSRC2-2 TaxID=2804571 RepID=UPI003CEC893F